MVGGQRGHLKKALLDKRDRRILGIGTVLLLGFMLIVLTLALAAGLGVRVFLLASGTG